MEEMTNKELASMCREAGLPDYGTKAVLIARLQKLAADELAKQADEPVGEQTEPVAEPAVEVASESAPVVEALKPQPMPAIITTASVDLATLPPAHHSKHVEDTLDALKNRFQGLIVVYDSNDEVFYFEGGAQGRVTTTARQPMLSIVNVAQAYYNVARGRRKNDFGELV